jgi:hypothetical protein
VQQPDRVGDAEREQRADEQPQRRPAGRPRRPGDEQQHGHGDEDQVGQRVRGRDADHARALSRLLEQPPGHRRPDQGHQRRGDQHAVDDKHHEVAPVRHGHRPGRRRGTDQQGQQRAERQHQETDVGHGQHGGVPVRVQHVGDQPPEAQRRPAGETGAEAAPPQPSGRAVPTGGAEADRRRGRARGELGRVRPQPLRGSGGQHPLAHPGDHGDKHQRHGQAHRAEPSRHHPPDAESPQPTARDRGSARCGTAPLGRGPPVRDRSKVPQPALTASNPEGWTAI